MGQVVAIPGHVHRLKWLGAMVGCEPTTSLWEACQAKLLPLQRPCQAM